MDERRPSRRRVLQFAATGSVGSLAALAGCLGDGDDDSDEAGEPADDESDDENPNENDEDGDVVTIETREGEADEPAFVFDPPVAELEPGTTVRWVNTDGVFHTVTATESLEERSPSEEFDEELAAEGDEFEWTPESKGVQHYYCKPHVGFMIGSLVVGDVDDETLEEVEAFHDGVDDEPDGTEDDEESRSDDPDGIDEAFVDATGEDVVTIETREGEDGEPAFVFDPAFVTVDAGTTIEWLNTDGVFHTVTSTASVDRRQGGGDVFDATISSEGASFEWLADEPGTQPYYCSPHAGFMYGALEIE